tara:strand:- start:693 stop:1529 length:837 start_codon:yes stop_codon:yes gene_type:complete
MSVTQVPIELSSTPGIVDNSNATAITIDSSENVMVNRTSVFTTAKMEIQSDAGDASTLALNSIDSDGSILEFYKAGAAVGSIAIEGTNDIVLYSNTANHVGLRLGEGYYLPTNNTGATADNAVDLGLSSVRFKDLYLAGGVNFGAAAGLQSNATSASNLLDDYEEGTFTVTVNGTSGGNNTAYYTKIGNTVFWQYYTGAKTFTTVQAKITGLPFTTSNASHNYACFFSAHNTATTDATSGYSSLNSTVAYFVGNNSVSSVNYNGGTQYFMVSGHYTVD